MEKLTIRQGKTFSKALRWGASPLIYRPITGIATTAPVRITATAHGLPPKWPVAVMGAAGLPNLNAQNNPPKPADFYHAAVVDADHIEINTVNAERFRPYTGGGQLVFYTPTPLDGYTARFVVRDKVGGAVLFSGTSVDGTVVIDAVNFTITIALTAVATAAMTWKKGVYELELTAPSGFVPSAFPIGDIEVVREVAA